MFFFPARIVGLAIALDEFYKMSAAMASLTFKTNSSHFSKDLEHSFCDVPATKQSYVHTLSTSSVSPSARPYAVCLESDCNKYVNKMVI